MKAGDKKNSEQYSGYHKIPTNSVVIYYKKTKKWVNILKFFLDSLMSPGKFFKFCEMND